MLTTIFFIFCIGLLFVFKKNEKIEILFMGIMFLLFLFSAFRFNYGNDYLSYYNEFNIIKSGGYSRLANDFLFYILVKILPNFFVFIFFTSCIYIYSIFKLIKRYVPTDKYWIAVFVLIINPYLFLIQLSTIRQTLAICFSLLYILSDKSKLKNIYLGCAITSHLTIIIFFIIYYFIRHYAKKIKFYHLIFICIIVGFIFLNSYILINIVVDISSKLTNNYLYYINTDITTSYRTLFLNVILYTIFVIGIFQFFKQENKNLSILIYLLLSFFGATCSVLSFYIPYLSRFQMYFDIFNIITIPLMLNFTNYRYVSKLIITSVMIIYVTRFGSFLTSDLYGPHYREYKTIIQNENNMY